MEKLPRPTAKLSSITERHLSLYLPSQRFYQDEKDIERVYKEEVQKKLDGKRTVASDKLLQMLQPWVKQSPLIENFDIQLQDNVNKLVEKNSKMAREHCKSPLQRTREQCKYQLNNGIFQERPSTRVERICELDNLLGPRVINTEGHHKVLTRNAKSQMNARYQPIHQVTQFPDKMWVPQKLLRRVNSVK